MNTKQILITIATLFLLSFTACNDNNPGQNDLDTRQTPNNRGSEQYNRTPPISDTSGIHDTTNNHMDTQRR